MFSAAQDDRANQTLSSQHLKLNHSKSSSVRTTDYMQGRNSVNIFDLSLKGSTKPDEINQFLNLINEDALIRYNKIFRDRNFDKVNKWYKAIKFLKHNDP